VATIDHRSTDAPQATAATHATAQRSEQDAISPPESMSPWGRKHHAER
jgi:hypothetical protein